MNTSKQAALAVVAGSIACIGLGSVAWAAGPDWQFGASSHEQRILYSSHVSLGEAIYDAERHTGARASSASLDRRGGEDTYVVTLIRRNGGEELAYVDPNTGVVSMTGPDERQLSSRSTDPHAWDGYDHDNDRGRDYDSDGD